MLNLRSSSTDKSVDCTLLSCDCSFLTLDYPPTSVVDLVKTITSSECPDELLHLVLLHYSHFSKFETFSSLLLERYRTSIEPVQFRCQFLRSSKRTHLQCAENLGKVEIGFFSRLCQPTQRTMSLLHLNSGPLAGYQKSVISTPQRLL